MSDQGPTQELTLNQPTSNNFTRKKLAPPSAISDERQQLREGRPRQLKDLQNWLVHLYEIQETLSYFATRVVNGQHSIIDNELPSDVISDIENLRVSKTFLSQRMLGWQILDQQAVELQQAILSVSYKWDDNNELPLSFLQLKTDLEWLFRLVCSSDRLCQVVGQQENLEYHALASHTKQLGKALNHYGSGLKKSALYCSRELKVNPEAVLSKKERQKLQETLKKQIIRRVTKQRYRDKLVLRDYYDVEFFVDYHHKCHPETIRHHIEVWNNKHTCNLEKQFVKEKIKKYKVPIWLTRNVDVAKAFLEYLETHARTKDELT